MKIISKEDTNALSLIQKTNNCSVSKAKKVLKFNNVLIDNKLASEFNPSLKKGQILEIVEQKLIKKENISILYEDKDIIAVEKPIGLLTMGTENNKDDTLYARINLHIKQKSHKKERVFIVHRLDQKVSGVILFAKSILIQNALKDNWKNYEKQYHALVEGHPPKDSDTIKSWLRENKNFKVFSGEKGPDAKLAITNYKIKEKFKHNTLLNIKLDTGRKNQIRVHLADIGCPIVGDLKYGALTNPMNRIGLHARQFKFSHPTTKEIITIESPTPKAFFNSRNQIL